MRSGLEVAEYVSFGQVMVSVAGQGRGKFYGIAASLSRHSFTSPIGYPI